MLYAVLHALLHVKICGIFNTLFSVQRRFLGFIGQPAPWQAWRRRAGSGGPPSRWRAAAAASAFARAGRRNGVEANGPETHDWRNQDSLRTNWPGIRPQHFYMPCIFWCSLGSSKLVPTYSKTTEIYASSDKLSALWQTAFFVVPRMVPTSTAWPGRLGRPASTQCDAHIARNKAFLRCLALSAVTHTVPSPISSMMLLVTNGCLIIRNSMLKLFDVFSMHWKLN